MVKSELRHLHLAVPELTMHEGTWEFHRHSSQISMVTTRSRCLASAREGDVVSHVDENRQIDIDLSVTGSQYSNSRPSEANISGGCAGLLASSFVWSFMWRATSCYPKCTVQHNGG